MMFSIRLVLPLCLLAVGLLVMPTSAQAANASCKVTYVSGSKHSKTLSYSLHCSDSGETLHVKPDNDRVRDVLNFAVLNRKSVRVSFDEKKRSKSGRYTVTRASLTLGLDKRPEKGLEECKVSRVEGSTKFKRCWLENCKGDKKKYKFVTESNAVFQMCMAASLHNRRVKATYHPVRGREKKLGHHGFLIYMRFAKQSK